MKIQKTFSPFALLPGIPPMFGLMESTPEHQYFSNILETFVTNFLYHSLLLKFFFRNFWSNGKHPGFHCLPLDPHHVFGLQVVLRLPQLSNIIPFTNRRFLKLKTKAQRDTQGYKQGNINKESEHFSKKKFP